MIAVPTMRRIPAHRENVFARIIEIPNSTFPSTHVSTLPTPMRTCVLLKIFLKRAGDSAAMTGTNVTSLLKIQEARLVPMMITANAPTQSRPAFDACASYTPVHASNAITDAAQSNACAGADLGSVPKVASSPGMEKEPRGHQ